MKRLAWLSDIHLNFLSGEKVRGFSQDVQSCSADAVLLGGDIGEAGSVAGYLEAMANWIKAPIYFVLGNHDFYRGSITVVRSRVAACSHNVHSLTWLDLAGAIEIAPRTALVGHSGWADGGLGDYEHSQVELNDYHLIREFVGLNRKQRLSLMQNLAAEAAAHVRRVLPDALQQYEHVIFLTHVPPFREACWHEGNISGAEWLPHFACKAVGEALLEIMADYPAAKAHGAMRPHPQRGPGADPRQRACLDRPGRIRKAGDAACT